MSSKMQIKMKQSVVFLLKRFRRNIRNEKYTKEMNIKEIQREENEEKC